MVAATALEGTLHARDYDLPSAAEAARWKAPAQTQWRVTAGLEELVARQPEAWARGVRGTLGLRWAEALSGTLGDG